MRRVWQDHRELELRLGASISVHRLSSFGYPNDNHPKRPQGLQPARKDSLTSPTARDYRTLQRASWSRGGAIRRPGASPTRRLVVARVRLAKILKVQVAGQASNFFARVGHMPESSLRDRPKESNLICVRKLAAGPLACGQGSVDNMRRRGFRPDVTRLLPESIDHELTS